MEPPIGQSVVEWVGWAREGAGLRVHLRPRVTVPLALALSPGAGCGAVQQSSNFRSRGEPSGTEKLADQIL